MATGVGGRTSNGESGQSWLGDSEMAGRLVAFDWAGTPLGPLEVWPQSLRSAVGTCLHSRFQMAIYWGPELNCIYNDAERDVLGNMHPAALGMPARELLCDSWDLVGPQLQEVMRTGTATWAEDAALTFDRGPGLKRGYFTYSYSPLVTEDGTVGGVLLVSQDTTSRVLAQRRLDLLREQSAEARGRQRERSFREAELHRLLVDLRAAQRRVASAADAERRKIEANLHDGAQQRLVAIRLELSLLDELLEHDPKAAHAELSRLHGELDEALRELRDLAHGLYPPLLASDGLRAALSAAAARAAIPVRIQSGSISRMPRAVESAAYFACLEALQNAAKHAGEGARATVHLALRDGMLTFSVRDDGQGFDPIATSRGQGLTNLRDRVGALGGTAELTSAPGGGTTVYGRIPVT